MTGPTLIGLLRERDEFREELEQAKAEIARKDEFIGKIILAMDSGNISMAKHLLIQRLSPDPTWLSRKIAEAKREAYKQILDEIHSNGMHLLSFMSWLEAKAAQDNCKEL